MVRAQWICIYHMSTKSIQIEYCQEIASEFKKKAATMNFIKLPDFFTLPWPPELTS